MNFTVSFKSLPKSSATNTAASEIFPEEYRDRCGRFFLFDSFRWHRTIERNRPPLFRDCWSGTREN